jgi:hypothetical protein
MTGDIRNKAVIKRSLLLLTFIAANTTSAMNTSIIKNPTKNKFSTTQKVLIGGTIGVAVTAAAIVAGPVVLPATTVVAIKAAAAGITAKATATAIAVKATTIATASAIASPAGVHTATTVASGMGGVKLGYQAVHFLRWYVYPTEKQELEQLTQEKNKETHF